MHVPLFLSQCVLLATTHPNMQCAVPMHPQNCSDATPSQGTYPLTCCPPRARGRAQDGPCCTTGCPWRSSLNLAGPTSCLRARLHVAKAASSGLCWSLPVSLFCAGFVLVSAGLCRFRCFVLVLCRSLLVSASRFSPTTDAHFESGRIITSFIVFRICCIAY